MLGKVLRVDVGEVVIGMEDASLRQVSLDKCNFYPQIDDQVQIFENGDEIISHLNIRGGVWKTFVRLYGEGADEGVSKRVATLELIDGSKRCRALKGDYVLKTVWGEIYTLDEESFLTSFEELPREGE